MLVKDIMTKNVVTVSSNTSVGEAKRVMKERKFRRLPVVDKGKLVGIVTEDRLEQVSPPPGASVLWQIHYLVSKTRVRDIMRKKVVTVEPEATVEQALSVAQSRNVGSLIVVQNGKIVGILTTNDFFYRIVNKTLGLGESGTRINVSGGGNGKSTEKIIGAVNKLGIKIKTLWTIAPPPAKKKDLILHLDTEDATPVIEALEAQGFSAKIRPR